MGNFKYYFQFSFPFIQNNRFKFRKFYVGRILTELEAAKIYDKLAIFYHGIQAKTNFKYTKADIINLVWEPVPNVEIH